MPFAWDQREQQSAAVQQPRRGNTVALLLDGDAGESTRRARSRGRVGSCLAWVESSRSYSHEKTT